MERGKLIAKFEIPEYLREIEVSKKQRSKYYYWDWVTIRAKGKKLLQKYINPDCKDRITFNNGNIKPHYLKYPYFIAGVIKCGKVIGLYGYKGQLDSKFIHSSQFNRFKINLTDKQKISKIEYILINIETKERVIANNTQAGKPKKIIIKGQDMYSGVLNEFTRAKIVKELKKDYKDKITWGKLNEIGFLLNNCSYNLESRDNYPVYIELEIIDTIKNHYDRTKEGNGIRWDVGNRAYPYLKTFVDFLVGNNVLSDDDRLHVSGESYFFTPCNRHEDRKLIFRIYKV